MAFPKMGFLGILAVISTHLALIPQPSLHCVVLACPASHTPGHFRYLGDGEALDFSVLLHHTAESQGDHVKTSLGLVDDGFRIRHLRAVFHGRGPLLADHPVHLLMDLCCKWNS